MPWILSGSPLSPPSPGPLPSAQTSGGANRPHLAWPIQFGPSGFVTAEQDSEDDVASCIAVICSWPLGTHPTDPSFGLPEQAFLQGGAHLDEIKAAILASEPRAASLQVMQDDSKLAAFLSSINVSFTVREQS